jgi:N-acetyl-anhydromuramyl-L-alanine amidase AmpD
MIPHPLVLVIGLLAIVGLTQGIIQTESQRLANNNSELTPSEEIEVTARPLLLLPTQPTLEPKPSPTITPTETPSPWSPNPLSTYKDLIDYCDSNQVDSSQWRFSLNQVTFPSDISKEAQEKLPNRVAIRPSCNYGLQNQPRAIVLHYTEGPLDATISTFQQPHNSSAHYVIDRDGKVYQIVPERFAAFHVNCYGNRNLCIPSCPVCDNSNGNFVEPRTQSIGIELVNLGHVDPRFYIGNSSESNNGIFEDYNDSFGYRFWEDYPQAQIHSLQILVEDIRARWNIPLNMVMGHSRINNNADPGPALNLFWFRYGYPPREVIFIQR